ncbi:MAG: hypothetical protein IPP25_10530 [Saprospiraceae bacterium]|nr:hypothetical protein [Candidatus Opimibacter skivensis]
MLTKTNLSLLLFFVTLSMNAQTPAYADTITIPILTERDTATSHEFHDVVIVYHHNRYIIDYYTYRDSMIWPYQIIIQTGPLYDKASYTWQTDRQAVIKLIDSESDFTMRFKVWGEGGGPAMEMLPD